MKQSATIIQELKELNSSLPTDSPVSGYQVPPGYFDGLATTVLQRVKTLEAATALEELAYLSPLLASLPKQLPYTVPAGYFSSLNPGIVFYEEMNAAEELEQLSPLLGNLSKKTPFTVPQGYFEKPLLVTEKAQKAPVIRMASRRWFKYAIAASVTAIVATGAFLWLNQRSVPGASKQPYAWVEKNLKKVSTDDISKFVELADETTPDVAKVATADIRGLLKNVSDREIQDFLKDVPTDETEDDNILLN